MRKFLPVFFLSVVSFFHASGQLKISQVYGAGGSAGATYKNDFIEIFNPTGSSVNLTGWSVQYSSSSGFAWTSTNLSGSIAAGKYFLIQMAGGANGANLPTPDLTGATALASNAGKIVLSNSTTVFSGSCPTGVNVIDFVGYGAANCYETAPAPNIPGTTTAIFRAGGGCIDNDNNQLDFALATPNPRNSASAANGCTSPFIISAPDISGLVGSTNAPSADSSYTLIGYNLSPASGNITITPSATVQVSLDNTIWSSIPVNVPYTGGALAAKTIYVRIGSGAAAGPFTGTVTNTGGGASSAIVNVSGTVYKQYYNTKANNGLNDVTTWSILPNGTGASPTDFSSNYQIFNITNPAFAFYTGSWDVTSANGTSKVVVGDGTNFVIFDILPGDDSVSSRTKIDVRDNAYLVLENNVLPTFNILYSGSTVDFSQAGITSADSIHIPAGTYHHLSMTNGLKYFSAGTTTINGDWLINTSVINGWNRGGNSTVSVNGDISFASGAVFDTDDNARIILSFDGTSGFESILTDAPTDVKLLRLQRGPSTPTDPIIIDASTSPATFYLGTTAGGGLTLNESGINTTEFDLGTNALIFTNGAGNIAGSGKLSFVGGDITFQKSSGASNSGVMYFVPGALLNSLTVNFDPAFTRDTLQVGTDVTVLGTLNLNKGKLLMTTGKTLIMEDGSVVAGGSVTSYVDGQMAKNGAADFTFPVGKGGKYAPLEIKNLSNFDTYTVRYLNSGYGSYSIDPATLGTFPNYTVSRKEHWIVSQVSGTESADLTFNYTDGASSNITNPSTTRIAHFDGVDWNDLGNDAFTGTPSVGSVTVLGVSQFSPFTFSTTNNFILPLRLLSFTGKAQSNGSLLEWKAANNEIGSYFVLERSSDAISFSDIVTVNTNGLFAEQSFSYLDTRALPGKNFYRLRMVSPRGSIEYSNIVLINYKTGKEITLLQNPVKDIVKVNLSALNTGGNVRITDLSGKLIMSQVFKATDYIIELPVQQLAGGTYILQVVTKDDVISRKFVKLND